MAQPQFDWDFGDGTTGSGMMPEHIYTAAGSYEVTLTVTNTDGSVDTIVATMTISEPDPPPRRQLSVGRPFATVGAPVLFNGAVRT